MFQTLIQILSKSWLARHQQQALKQQEIAGTEHQDGLERLTALKHSVRIRQTLKTNFQQTSSLNKNHGQSLREKQNRVLRQSQYRMQAASITAQTTIQSFSGSWEMV